MRFEAAVRPTGGRYAGLVAAGSIILLWLGHLLYSLSVIDLRQDGVVIWIRVVLHMLIQGYLYTGLFITSHDSMHGSVSPNRRLNRLVGQVAASLFAAFTYKRLLKYHMEHHRYPAEERDPDYSPKSQNFFVWFFRFFSHYVTIRQLLMMALVFNLLILLFPEPNVLLFWVVPAFLGTFQLFFFGTFLPHRLPHTPEMEPHRARSQKTNFLLGLLSCYFFGYHWEHHQAPRVPWWRMHRYRLSRQS